MTGGAAADDDWVSLHVFYAGNADPLLVECIVPLVRRLRESRLIRRYFFIRYWLEGPHVRLRLLPTRQTDRATVRSTAEAALATYLVDRPAASSEERPESGERYRELYVAEYGTQGWDDAYGPKGMMPLRANNSVHNVPYEREYLRYGGPAGIEVAEWHFEHSSDVVLGLLEAAGTLGTAARWVRSAHLTTTMCYALLGSDTRVSQFLGGYRAGWEAHIGRTVPADGPDHDRTADRLRPRIDRIRTNTIGTTSAPADGAGPPADWLAHCRQLRDRLVDLVGTGQILPRPGAPMTDPDLVLRAMLSSYVHMTNNRLGVTILDEIHLSGLVHATLRPAVNGPPAAL